MSILFQEEIIFSVPVANNISDNNCAAQHYTKTMKTIQIHEFYSLVFIQISNLATQLKLCVVIGGYFSMLTMNKIISPPIT